MAEGSRRAGTIVTIGYEGKSIDEVVDRLTAQGASALIDVRENAFSRKPGFSKRALAEAVEHAGIHHDHEPLLGNPKENRARFADGRLAEGRERYLAHLEDGSRAAFDRLIDLANNDTIAILCFENDHRYCHRDCIAVLAQEENPDFSVIHA